MVSISWPHDLPALASQSAGITGVSHLAQLVIRFYKPKRCLEICKIPLPNDARLFKNLIFIYF